MNFSGDPLTSDELAIVTSNLTSITAKADALGFGWTSSQTSTYAASTDSSNTWRRILIRIILWILDQLAGTGG